MSSKANVCANALPVSMKATVRIKMYRFIFVLFQSCKDTCFFLNNKKIKLNGLETAGMMVLTVDMALQFFPLVCAAVVYLQEK